MRLVRPAVAIVIALALAPAAAAHETAGLEHAPPGTYLNHLQPWEITLGPGENTSQALAFEGTPMPAGWLLVVHAVVDQGTVAAALEDNGTLAAWSWSEGEHAETIRLDHTGYPRLVVRNEGSGNATLTASYDQTCDCLGKSTAGERGVLFFNVDAQEGERVRFSFNILPVRATIATPSGAFNGTLDVRVDQVVADARGEELTVLRTWTASDASDEAPDCTGAGRFNLCMEVSFDASHDGRQVLLMEAAHDMEGWVTQVRPVVEIGPGDRGAPMVWFLPGAAILVAWRGRRR